jgi:cytochrome c oxidase assembly factor CtaG
LTAHVLQYLAVTAVAAPLLVWGLRPALVAWAVPGARSPADGLARPLGAALAFNAVLIASHVPGVADRLLVSPSGMFALDLAWLASGLVFWWPVMVAMTGPAQLGGPGAMLYLFLGGIPSHGVGALVTLAPYPLYAVYELAPRVGEIGARADQQLAGLLMWLGATFVGIVAMSVVFFRWARREDDDPALPLRLGQPGGPGHRDEPARRV